MAIYHLHAQIIKRSAGRSSVAAAAYRAAEKIHDERTDLPHDYTRKTGVVHSEIMLPENAPLEFQDRAALWNAVEKAEKRADSQTAREFDIALPIEFDRDEQIEIMREYARKNFVNHGMCADLAIHDRGDGNPHAHVMLTTRHVAKDGFGGKNRDWNQTQLLEKWRENWAEICNEKFAQKGLDVRIDHRTLEAQGIDREPTIHVGIAAKHMEQRGFVSERAEINREIIARNEARKHEPTPEETAELIHELGQGHEIVNQEISVIKQEISELDKAKNATRIKAEEIDERAEYIKSLKRQADELRIQHEEMGIFTSKKGVYAEAQRLEQSYDHAVKNFVNDYHVNPNQAKIRIADYEAQLEKMTEKIAELRSKLPTLQFDRDTFKLEYHKMRLLAGISRGRQQILDRLKKLEDETLKNRAEGKLSRREILANLARRKSKSTLGTLTTHEYQKILHELPPKQAKAIIAHKEREKEMEKEIEFIPSL